MQYAEALLPDLSITLLIILSADVSFAKYFAKNILQNMQKFDMIYLRIKPQEKKKKKQKKREHFAQTSLAWAISLWDLEQNNCKIVFIIITLAKGQKKAKLYYNSLISQIKGKSIQFINNDLGLWMSLRYLEGPD